MKKRILSILLVLALSCGLVPTTALAAGEWIDAYGIQFDASTGTIEDCDASVAEIIIPSEINGTPVTKIAEYAFNGCTALSSITLPSSITSIGAYAFNGCTSLQSIAIPNGVTKIADYTFNGCTSLRNVTLPDNVTTIGEGSFKSCSALVELSLPANLTRFDSYAFQGCSSLANITIPNKVTYITTAAFRDCTSLKSVSLPSGITTIWGYAFAGCTSLNSIELPSTLTEIDDSAFSDCTSLTSIRIPDKVAELDNFAFSGCTSLKSVELSNGLTTIGSFAFDDCTSLSEIKLPNSLNTIGQSAFGGCSSLTSIDIPASVTSIGSNAFRGCSSLNNIVVPSGVAEIENDTFCDCTSLTSVSIPNSVTSIGIRAFQGCSSLTNIIIPSGATKIGNYAFYGCTSLTSVTIPASVRNIGIQAFDRCSNLSDIYFAGSEEQWKKITSGDNLGGDSLDDVLAGSGIGINTKTTRIHCNATGPENPGDLLLNDYTVEVVSRGGGTVSGGGTFKKGTTVTVTAVPEEGYDFSYWKMNGTVCSEEASYTFTVTDDIQLDAFFGIVYNIITLNTNGGNSMSRIAVASGDTLDLGAYVPIKDGYTFDGWYSDSALTNKVTSVTPTADMTLYAKWVKNPVVTFQTNGGNAMSSVSVLPGASVNLNQYIPTREGYAFSGWYADQNLTTAVSTVTVNEDMTVYAKWTAEGYTLTFETNGGSTINALTAAPGTVVSLSQYIPVKECYAFGGWYADEALTTAVSSVTVSADTTVYAKWDAAKYTLTFETNGGSAISSLPVSSEVTVSLAAYIPTRTGYQFAGWYSDKALTKPVSEIKLTGDITIYAKWTEQPVVSVLPFTDVKENDWFYGDVKYVYENNLMNGVGDGLFGPGGTTTRGMIVTILYRLEGEPAAALSRFQDVASNMYYAKAVGWAASNGVVNGTSATTFAPNAPITREQMAAILYRYAQYKGYGVTERVDLSKFTDAGNISEYAVNAISWANAKGLINGVGEAQLNPTGQASRSQVAAILHRFCTLIA